MVDILGYRIGYDAPTINIMCGASMNSLKDSGVWKLGESKEEHNEESQETQMIEGKSVVEFTFVSPVPCRIIQLSVSIPTIPNASNFIHLGRLQVIGKLSTPNVLSHSNIIIPTPSIVPTPNPPLSSSNNSQNSPSPLPHNTNDVISASPLVFNSPAVKKNSISPSERTTYEKIYNSPSPINRSQVCL